MRYRFLEALDKIAGTERRIKRSDTMFDYGWTVYDADKGRLIRNGDIIPWPCLEDQQAERWEIEDEPIYIWAVCNIQGNAILFKEEPVKDEYGHWCSGSIHDPLYHKFSEDNPQKFKLVPIEETI